VPVNLRYCGTRARLHAGRRGRPASNLVHRAGRRDRCSRLPVSPQTLGETNVSVPLAAILSQADALNVLLAVFNMIPIPPLDGGNVLRACCRVARRVVQSLRPYGFLLLYALILSGGFDYIVVPPYRFILSWLPTVTPQGQRVVSRHAADRPPASRPSRRRARQLGAAAGQYDCFYFVADWHALTSDFADTSQLTSYAYDNVADWIGAGLDPGEEHVLRPVAGARARRAVPAAVDGRAGAVARARADLQGAAGEPEGQGSLVDRLSRLSAAADGRRRDVRRAFVPVGEDQVAHLELAREVVRRFNNVFGATCWSSRSRC
jgi:hypothetical protein